MGILCIGIGLLIGIRVWIERSEHADNSWRDDQERRHFEQERQKWTNDVFYIE